MGGPKQTPRGDPIAPQAYQGGPSQIQRERGGFTLRRRLLQKRNRSEIGICTKYVLFFENFILFVSMQIIFNDFDLSFGKFK